MAAACLYLISAAAVSAGQWPWSNAQDYSQRPHPAVVRISVEESDGVALGSGSLVDVRGELGLVITNWHVVRDAAGAITVLFPDGFRSAARILRMDRAWDLAALLIWRPRAAPIPIANAAPRPGEPLTIAGYGPGHYRTVMGRCTQYLAPSDHHPFEIVELSAAARQGDSGGPIFNASGELAGVLFGSGGGTTSGSYAGRVHQFLATIWPPNGELDALEQVASARDDRKPRRGLQRLPETGSDTTGDLASTAPLQPLPEANASTLLGGDNASPQPHAADREEPSRAETPDIRATSLSWKEIAGDSLFEQCKTFLAILGFITLLYHLTRVVAPGEQHGQNSSR
jgi:S1-C subfamily serine protease